MVDLNSCEQAIQAGERQKRKQEGNENFTFAAQPDPKKRQWAMQWLTKQLREENPNGIGENPSLNKIEAIEQQVQDFAQQFEAKYGKPAMAAHWGVDIDAVTGTIEQVKEQAIVVQKAKPQERQTALVQATKQAEEAPGTKVNLRQEFDAYLKSQPGLANLSADEIAKKAQEWMMNKVFGSMLNSTAPQADHEKQCKFLTNQVRLLLRTLGDPSMSKEHFSGQLDANKALQVARKMGVEEWRSGERRIMPVEKGENRIVQIQQLEGIDQVMDRIMQIEGSAANDVKLLKDAAEPKVEQTLSEKDLGPARGAAKARRKGY